MEIGKKVALIKYGGHAMDLPELREAFGNDLRRLQTEGWNFAIVHGGGPHIARLLERMQIESSFVDGLRVTDGKTLEVVEMVLCGQVNKELTRMLAKQGAPVVGISGEDGPILVASQKSSKLGRVGAVIKVNPELPLYLMKGGYIPLIAPLALDEEFEPLNVNADTAAGALAGALHAACFILLSDVPGVLDAKGKLLPLLSGADIGELIKTGVISGGMIPKVQACLHATEEGCHEAIILDARQKNCLQRFLAGDGALGTIIRP